MASPSERARDPRPASAGTRSAPARRPGGQAASGGAKGRSGRADGRSGRADGRRPSGTRRRSSRLRSSAVHYLPILLFVLGSLALNALWPIPLWIAGVYVIASVVCFFVYLADKSAARSQRWRVPEATLLVWGALGGWPGAIVAQQTLRHKTQKASFRRAFWASVILNLVVFALVATPVAALVLDAARPLP